MFRVIVVGDLEHNHVWPGAENREGFGDLLHFTQAWSPVEINCRPSGSWVSQVTNLIGRPIGHDA